MHAERQHPGGDPPGDRRLGRAAFTFSHMTALAYVGALVTDPVGRVIVDAAGG